MMLNILSCGGCIKCFSWLRISVFSIACRERFEFMLYVYIYLFVE